MSTTRHPTSRTTPIPSAQPAASPDQRVERTLKAIITTESGSTYHLDGDHLRLDGPVGGTYDEFVLISLDNARIIYTDGQEIFRSSPIASLSMA